MFAGLYESWRDPKTEEWTRTFTILTTDANDVVAPVHDRMPVILPADVVDDWIYRPADPALVDTKALRSLLRPAPNDAIVATAVSRRANSVANDDEGVLAPADDREPTESPRLL
jgi:putative SOS response-associated peptidase YedK